nr:hypothetical protein [Muribaculaceae bacterium]
VYPVCRPLGNASSSEWKDIPQLMGNPGYLILTANGGSYAVADADFELPRATNVKAQSGLYANTPYSVTADLTNVAEFEMFMPVASGIATLSNNQLNLISSGDVLRLDLNAGATANYTFTGNFGTASTQPGDYYFVIYDPSRGEVLYYAPVTAQANPGKAEITCRSFTIDGGTQGVNAAAIKFNAEVSVTAGYLAKPLVIALFDDQSATSIDVTQFPVSYLSAGENASLSTTYAFNIGEIGKSYMAGLYDPDDTSNVLAYLRFTVGTSGVDNVDADAGIEIAASADGITVTTGAGIVGVEVFRLDGTAVALPTASGVASLTIPSGTITPGVYAVRATDMAGRSVTRKISVR